MPPIFLAASYLTDPICKSHEFYRRIYVVNHLVKKFFLLLGIIACSCLASLTTAPGIALRGIACYLQKKPFTCRERKAAAEASRTFSLLSWNICCVNGGYPISDGGVMPWTFRIDKIIHKILERNADVNCFYEVFDIQTALRICNAMEPKGYTQFYFNIGPKPIGVSSGMMIASRYRLYNPEFTPFPQETLVGRTKYAAKGVFSFDVGKVAHVCATHLQHSEEPFYPTKEEKIARRKQMEVVLEKKAPNQCNIITGDFNEEIPTSRFTGKTWGGDAFCAQMVGKRVSPPMNLDGTLIMHGTIIQMSLVETGYDATSFKSEALSDHAGLYTVIASGEQSA